MILLFVFHLFYLLFFFFFLLLYYLSPTLLYILVVPLGSVVYTFNYHSLPSCDSILFYIEYVILIALYFHLSSPGFHAIDVIHFNYTCIMNSTNFVIFALKSIIFLKGLSNKNVL